MMATRARRTTVAIANRDGGRSAPIRAYAHDGDDGEYVVHRAVDRWNADGSPAYLPSCWTVTSRTLGVAVRQVDTRDGGLTLARWLTLAIHERPTMPPSAAFSRAVRDALDAHRTWERDSANPYLSEPSRAPWEVREGVGVLA